MFTGTRAFVITLCLQLVLLELRSTELNPTLPQYTSCIFVILVLPPKTLVQIVFGTQSGTIWVLDSASSVDGISDTTDDNTPIWAWVLICISCFFGGVLLSAMVVYISGKLSAKNVDSMKKPLLSHHDAL